MIMGYQIRRNLLRYIFLLLIMVCIHKLFEKKIKGRIEWVEQRMRFELIMKCN